jgi:hypothetical protein
MSLIAQQTDTTQITQPPQQKEMKQQQKQESKTNKVYYGGTIGLSFGSYFRIAIMPLVGYKLSPKASGGVKFVLEYIEDKSFDPKLTSTNYGGSVFTRYRLLPQIYAHAEFAYLSYKFQTSSVESNREWVPYLLLGGGYVQPISPKAAAFVEVLVDVINDKNSPYERWNPWISVGVAAGF